MHPFIIKQLRRAPIIKPMWDEFERMQSSRAVAFAERDAAVAALNVAVAERDAALAGHQGSRSVLGTENRSLPFRHRQHGRYWWFWSRVHDYVPSIFAVLTDEEWEVLDQWYSETDSRQSAAEANIPPLSFLVAMLDGNGISNLVQLGHYEGFSTLLLGFAMRRMGFKHSIFSVDISPESSRICEHWIERAGLSDYVSINVASSEAPHLPKLAHDYFGADIQTVFIDSSHQYQHTVDELNLWFPALKPSGFIFLHDASETAAQFDSTEKGGVLRALEDWLPRDGALHLIVNKDATGGTAPVYQDSCGLGIIHKRFAPG